MDNKIFYEEFDWDGFKEEVLKAKVKKVLDIIPDDVNTIADIGCGNGIITNVLAQHYEVFAVDRSAKALSFVNAKKIQASADDIPLESESVDMVFSSEMLEHLEESVLNGSIAEFKRLSKKYIFITVPNDENPDKLSIKCPECNYVYNRPNHLRSFKEESFDKLFPEYERIKSFSFGKKVRYYNPTILKLKRKLSPHHSWIPYYWISENDRETFCPNCEHTFRYEYKFNLIAFILDIVNVILSPKKPYWLFVLLKKS
ncbi:MAG: class I SAM-dependent methyltransferase [Bacteroidales bacterium]|nr:class I SAM-dependent methyltransferase [Bacteroidales bacterium]